MTKIEKIKTGMALIKEGCSEISLWTECIKCPFNTYCTFIRQNTDKCQTPNEWQLEDQPPLTGPGDFSDNSRKIQT